MPDPKHYASKAQAARNRGLAPPEIIQQARPGAVFAVKDEAIQFPAERLGKARTFHETRRVLVIQGALLNAQSNPNTITVVPCSASQFGLPGDWEFSIPPEEEGFDATGVVAYLSLIQPVLKSDLIKCYGYLKDTTLLEIQKKIGRNLGLISSTNLKLPPRADIRLDDVATPAEHKMIEVQNVAETDV